MWIFFFIEIYELLACVSIIACDTLLAGLCLTGNRAWKLQILGLNLAHECFGVGALTNYRCG